MGSSMFKYKLKQNKSKQIKTKQSFKQLIYYRVVI